MTVAAIYHKAAIHSVVVVSCINSELWLAFSPVFVIWLFCDFFLLQSSRQGRESLLVCFWGIRFSRLFRGRKSCHCFCVELENFLPEHQYSIDIFSYSGPSGMVGSNG